MNVNKTIYALGMLLFSSSLSCNDFGNQLNLIRQAYNSNQSDKETILTRLAQLKQDALTSSGKICHDIDKLMHRIQAPSEDLSGTDVGEVLFGRSTPATNESENDSDWLLN